MKEIFLFLKILGVNLRHHFLLPLAAAAGVVMLTPVFFNINALQETEAVRPLESWLCFVGAVLIVSVLLPEQDKNIRDVICARKCDYCVLLSIRLLYSAVAVTALIAVSAAVMRVCECDVRIEQVLCAAAGALFLGAVGFAAAGLTGNVTAGYMAAVLYYLANYGRKDKSAVFFLFPMSSGKSPVAGVWLAGGAVCMMFLTVGVIKYRHKWVTLRIKCEDK